jgi:pyruvate/2-oxoglutarate dehydrogenase complex dihydrolipoamide acyltransferase (E2) component
MDEAFSLIATEMPRTRRLSPFGVRAITVTIVWLALTVTFASWVVGQQRAADVRRSEARSAQIAAREAEAAAAVQAAATATPIHASNRVVNGLLDEHARETASAAMSAAMQVARTSSFQEATATALGAVEHDVVFIDGPSNGPSVVSVFASAAAWSAAVQGPEGSCYWVALSSSGTARYGTGSRCTGMAALAAARDSW